MAVPGNKIFRPVNGEKFVASDSSPADFSNSATSGFARDELSKEFL
jgi:hypothetical protein